MWVSEVRRAARQAITVAALCVIAPASAQAQLARQVAPPAAVREEIRLPFTQSSPAIRMRETWLQVATFTAVRGVTVPTITPVLPAPSRANGTAVVIAPGGGFRMLSMMGEGFDVARYLADHGIAVFVLKYRLQSTPDDPDAFMKDFIAWNSKTKDPVFFRPYLDNALKLSTEDAANAMRWVRANATRYGIDSKRVGFMGFSAGALTALSLAYSADPGAAPDFIAPIYASFARPQRTLPAKLPPMWAAIATDDEYFKDVDLGLIDAWKTRGDVEFHLYDRGRHGFGFSGTPGTTSVHWAQEFLWWLEARKLLPAPK